MIRFFYSQEVIQTLPSEESTSPVVHKVRKKSYPLVDWVRKNCLVSVCLKGFVSEFRHVSTVQYGHLRSRPMHAVSLSEGFKFHSLDSRLLRLPLEKKDLWKRNCTVNYPPNLSHGLPQPMFFEEL